MTQRQIRKKERFEEIRERDSRERKNRNIDFYPSLALFAVLVPTTLGTVFCFVFVVLPLSSGYVSYSEKTEKRKNKEGM